MGARSDRGAHRNADHGKVVIAHTLTIAAFVLTVALRAPPMMFVGLVVAFVAAALAYINRRAAMPWANTHHEHALRTLIIGYSIWALAGALVLINGVFLTVTIYAQLAIALWALIRAAIALVLGIMRKPIPHPRGLLV